MNHEFHVGDYVETVEGATGYVVESQLMYFDKIPVKYYLAVRFKDRDYRAPYNVDDLSLPAYFRRIGQYDFTKEDSKITPLDKFEGSTMWTTALERCRLKINECVDAVNELRAAQKGGE